MILFALIAILTALALVLASRRGSAPARLIWAAAATAPALVALAILQAGGGLDRAGPDRWGDLRLNLQAVRVSGPDLQRGLTLGGASRDDPAAGPAPQTDLVIDGAPSGLLSFARAGDALGLRVFPTPGDPRTALVRLGRPASGDYVGAAPFDPGDVLCVEACGGPGAVQFRLSWDGARLERLGDPTRRLASIPRRIPVPLIPSVNDWAPTTRIFPLRDYGAPTPEVRGGDTPCGARVLCRADGSPVRSILFRRGGLLGGRLYAALLDSGARLVRKNGATLPGPNGETVAALDPGRTLEVAVLSVDYAGSDLPLSQKGAPWSRLSERRSFRAIADADGLRLNLDTPTTRLIRRHDLDQAIAEARLVAKREGTRPRSDTTIEVQGDVQGREAARQTTSLAFPALGGALGRQIAARLVLPGERAAQAFTLIKTSAPKDGALRLTQPFGRPFWLGQDSAALFSLDRLDAGAGALALWPWLLPLAALLAVWTDQRRRRAATWFILAAGLEFLLGLRLIVAIEGAYVDAGPEAAHAVGDALAAFVAVPFLFALLGQPSPRRLVEVAAHGLFVLAALFAIHQTGRVGSAWWALALSVAAALTWLADARTGGHVGSGMARLGRAALAMASKPVRAVTASSAWGKTRTGLQALGDLASSIWRKTGLLGAWIGKGWTWFADGAAALPRWALTLGAVLFLARGALGLAGFKESITGFGPRLSLSLIYAPAMIVVFAGLLDAASRPPAKHNRAAALIFWIYFALLGAVIPVLVKDNGFVIYTLPIALWGLLVHLEDRPVGRRWGLETVAGVLVCIALVWAPFVLSQRLGTGATLAILGVAAAVAAGVALAKSRSVMWAVPALAALAVLLVLNLTPKVDEHAFEAAANSRDDAPVYRLLGSYAAEKQNSLRIWTFMQPQKVLATGTTESEQFLASMAHLSDYTRSPTGDEAGRGVFGRGFLNLPAPTVLRAYHLNDNVTAVHLISPFGRAGAAAFLAVLWAFAAGLTVLALREAGDLARLGWRATAGLLAAWTVALVTTYMVLANLQLAPFTGKNAYFLVAVSTSDLLEGCALFAMAGLMLGKRR